MMRIRCLQHVPFEGPAAIADWANGQEYELTISHLYEGVPLPELGDFDALVIMGGPMSVNDEDSYDWLRVEKRLVRDAVEAGHPVFGVCLGAQLIAAAMGARVYPGPEKEIGWFPVRRVTDAGLGSLLPESFTPFHWHGETFDLPAGAVRLAETDVTSNQAFQLGDNVVGMQFHIEATPASVGALVENCQDEIDAGRFMQPAEALLDCSEKTAAVNPILYSLLDSLFLQ